MKPSTPPQLAASVDKGTDDELVKLFCSGNQEAFDVLFDRHHRSVYHYARTILRDAHEAEDVLQETFLAVARTASRYEPQGRFKAWIMRIARNKSFKILEARKTRWYPGPDREVYVNLETFLGPGPRECASAKQQMSMVKRALHALPESQREAILLYAFDDMKYREIAEVMEMPVNTVKTLIYRARAALAQAVMNEER